jgi:hypothetical protein
MAKLGRRGERRGGCDKAVKETRSGWLASWPGRDWEGCGDGDRLVHRWGLRNLVALSQVTKQKARVIGDPQQASEAVCADPPLPLRPRPRASTLCG